MGQWDGSNRRKFPRAKYPCLVVLKNKDKGEERFLAHTENIGSGGLCIIVKENIKMFSEVEVEIDLMDLEEHISCKGKVVWNVKRNDEEKEKPLFYDIGIELKDLKDQERARIEKVTEMVTKKLNDEEPPK